MAKSQSRPARWSEACQEAREALAKIEEGKSSLEEALSKLNDLKSEYEEWQGNLPENLQGSALGEKLDAIVNIDFEPSELDLTEIEGVIDEAEGCDLPRGFGKD